MSDPFLVVPGAAPDDPPIAWTELTRMSIAAREVARRALSGDEAAHEEIQEVIRQGVSARLNSRAYVSAYLLRDAVNEEQWRRARGEVVVRTVDAVEVKEPPAPSPPAPAPEPAVVVGGSAKQHASPPATCDHAPNLRCKHCVGASFMRKP